METSVDSYLHKKFKKQLSIEPRTVVVSAENPKRPNNKDDGGVVVESTSDQSWRETRGASPASEVVTDDAHQRRRHDNIHQHHHNHHHHHHHAVPNSSTNLYRSDSVARNENDSTTNVVKSSISLETNRLINIERTRDNISYIRNVVANDDDNDNFDTKFSCNVGLKSSNSDGNLFKYNYDNNDGEQTNNDPNPIQQQQQQQQPDKTTGGKYVCTYCNLACSKPSVLQKHIRAHTNERPYPCVSCGFSFKTRSNLYKHCRSRTHANRVLGSKARGELTNDEQETYDTNVQQLETQQQEPKTKLYKPRFHTIGNAKTYNPEQQQQQQISKENIEDENNRPTDILSHHINDIINKNNAKINADTYLKPSLNSECANVPQRVLIRDDTLKLADEPLNLTNKGRKRCISEAVESKSLIKELLLQNLSSDMQCPHCKMIFQTVTELELHKLRSCKGFVRPGAKYTRSSSVNVASILTQNKNAFDTIPQMQFPLKSPGPFLGKTRLVESDKNKSFSFDDSLANITSMYPAKTSKYLLSPLKLQNEEKKTPVKLFGGELKITETTGESKSFNIEKHENYESSNFLNYSGKMSENRVIKSGLHSGGTVLTNKGGNFNDGSLRGYDPAPETSIFNEQRKRPPDLIIRPAHDELNSPSPSYIKYTNIIDFSQNAVKLLTPNLKQPNLTVPGVPVPNKFTYNATPGSPLTQPLKIEVGVGGVDSKLLPKPYHEPESQNMYNPMNILVDGKVVRYVPGIPGPVVAETPVDMRNVPQKKRIFEKLEISVDPPCGVKNADAAAATAARSPVIKTTTDMKSPQLIVKNEKKFARPNSLALKPTSASLKQHHGLTPTMFNQILISPDTPRVAKKYVQQYLNGNYFSYLGLKSTTKPVYCTLNKTQPFYVPHFKTLSMYSEWRQQDTKTDKLYVAGYDSRQRSSRFTVAGLKNCDLMAHSSYKSTTPDSLKEKDDGQKTNPIMGGYECNEDYTYIRGRGRGRYVCEQCGIRCKKPSMLKKHIRTHSNDRPYTCSHCNFSFKTKGNLTKHMKSKAHTKNSTTSSSSSSSNHQSGTPSSESDTEDSGMDSSDESTRQQEHEAAYGLLSLSQKSTHNLTPNTFSPISTTGSINEQQQQHNSIMNIDEITHVTKTNYAKNKFLEPGILQLSNIKDMAITLPLENERTNENYGFFGKTCVTRPLTYPYVMSEMPIIDEPMSVSSENTDISSRIIDVTTPSDTSESRNIKNFHVIQRYASDKDYSSDESYVDQNLTERSTCVTERGSNVTERSSNVTERSVIVTQNLRLLPDKTDDLRKRKLSEDALITVKLQKSDEVMDLSVRPLQDDVIHKPNGLNYHETSDYRDFHRLKLNGDAAATLDVRIARTSSSPPPPPQIGKSYVDFDNSAMETLADIATKQVKLEKNAMAKSVASEYLKLATKQDFQGENERIQAKGVNDLIVKPEGSKSCTICSKSFNKPSQLRLHMNVHYLERPFRCDSCSVSFRTKGHLQKHERSASHHNKLSSSPALSSSEPRPFKCADCNIAFRIHGHLAKHLRSKMHIMKLECLAKIPFGLYAELERSNSLLTEINTADGDQCLESLKTLAKKVFLNDPGKLKHLVETPSSELETD